MVSRETAYAMSAKTANKCDVGAKPTLIGPTSKRFTWTQLMWLVKSPQKMRSILNYSSGFSSNVNFPLLIATYAERCICIPTLFPAWMMSWWAVCGIVAIYIAASVVFRGLEAMLMAKTCFRDGGQSQRNISARLTSEASGCRAAFSAAFPLLTI